MEEENSSYYSEDSERNLTSEEELEDDNELDDEHSEDNMRNYETRTVYGLRVIEDNISATKHINKENNVNLIERDLGFKMDGSDGKTNWIRILIDNSIQTDHVVLVDKIIRNVFNDISISECDDIEFPLKLKIEDKRTDNEETLIIDFKSPRGDEVLLADIPSQSKHVVNSLIAHLYIYRCNNSDLEFINHHADSEINSGFGFKSWHKYKHM